MNSVRWPGIRQEQGLVNQLLLSDDGFWVASPSILHVCPALRRKSPFLVGKADFPTLLRLQQTLMRERPSRVYAIGGGKVLDIAKLALRLGPLDDRSDIELGSRKWIERGEESAVPLTAIPATAGTGSEVSEIAVLTVGDRKVPLYHATLLPDEVAADIDVLRAAPRRVIWNGIWDTFVHALESAVSPLASDFTRRWSDDALAYTAPLIDALTDKGALADDQLAHLQWNSIVAGKAQSIASVGLAHALAHQAEGDDQWHGEACARVLPQVIRFNMDKAREKYEPLAQKLGFSAVEPWLEWLHARVRGSVGEWLRPMVAADQRAEWIKRIVSDPCFRTNAVYRSRAEMSEWLDTWFFQADEQKTGR